MLAFILCANIAPDKWFILTATSSTICPSPWLSPLYITDCEYKANDERTYTPSQDPPPLSHAVGSALELRYAVHDSLVMADFFGLFLLKIANLFSAELDRASRAALGHRCRTARLPPSSLFFAHALTCTQIHARAAYHTCERTAQGRAGAEQDVAGRGAVPRPKHCPAARVHRGELGTWADDRGTFKPSSIVLWLQEHVYAYAPTPA